MSLSALSRQLSQLAIRHNVTPTRLKATTSMRAVQMISQGKKMPASSSSPLLIRWQSSNGNDETSKDAISSLASEKWEQLNTNFQVDMDSFDGPSEEKPKQKKTRGGKFLRKQRQKELLGASAADGIIPPNDPSRFTDVGPGQFPPLRFDDAKTEELLQQAYANIPPRMGKRGTRRAKRMRHKFRRMRRHHAQYKKERIAHHFRTMEKRSRIAKEVRAVKEGAEEVRSAEKDYQMEVLKQFAKMTGLTEQQKQIQG